MKILGVSSLAILLILVGLVFSENPKPKEVGDWLFWPDYRLERRARTPSPPSTKGNSTKVAVISTDRPPLLLHGRSPTERRTNLLESGQLPTESFSLELWFKNHVNQPIDMLICPRDSDGQPVWMIHYSSGSVSFTPPATAVPIDASLRRNGFKNYWHHVVATVSDLHTRLYVNGRLILEDEFEQLLNPKSGDLEISAYFENEPYMELGNLLKRMRLLKGSLNAEQVEKRYAEMQEFVNSGIRYPNEFHFNAGPYLNFSTQTSINLLWETNIEAKAVIEYGPQLPMTEKATIDSAAKIQETTLEGLQPGTPYFYRVRAISTTGLELRSGILTFNTAVKEDEAFAFAVVGDTESRPHINNQIAKLIWDERPNFLMHVGDITDGGRRRHKFEWNHEYFLGMNQLISRVPMFPVPGNGEGDLYWYKRYHKLPSPEGFYSFRYGNAEFFMLDSNQRESGFAPGGRQYEWLENALKNSKATWKFAAHHHPTYTSDEDDYGNTWRGPSELGDKFVRQILPLYEKYGVNIVFFGHLHTYERTWPIKDGKVSPNEGVVYVQTGGAGGNLEDFTPTRTWFSNKTYRGHHYCTVKIHGDRLEFQMFDVEGRMRDHFGMRRP